MSQMYGPDPYPQLPIRPDYGPFCGPSGCQEDPGYEYPGYFDDNPTWVDLISQGIGAAQDVARVAVGGYPPQDIYAPIYAPQYPSPTLRQDALPPAPPKPVGGVQISTTTLIFAAGAFLLFFAGKRSR